MDTTDMQTLEAKNYREDSRFSAQISSLETLLPDRQEEMKLQKSRAILGEVATKMTDEQIQTTISEFEFLGSEWLDEFERKIFEGKTLRELLQTR